MAAPKLSRDGGAGILLDHGGGFNEEVQPNLDSIVYNVGGVSFNEEVRPRSAEIWLDFVDSFSDVLPLVFKRARTR